MVKKEIQKTLSEQGYTLTSVENIENGINVIYLKKDNEEFVGTMDDKFNWLMEPTDKYGKELEFHDGLAAISIPEERKMILANDADAKVWGFINPKGKMVIKSQYRSVNASPNYKNKRTLWCA